MNWSQLVGMHGIFSKSVCPDSKTNYSNNCPVTTSTAGVSRANKRSCIWSRMARFPKAAEPQGNKAVVIIRVCVQLRGKKSLLSPRGSVQEG